jgi:hypothetical protein
MFSDFRSLMDRWDRASRIMVESDLCLFFRKDGRLYGAGEPSRITFARMKNPETKEDKEWRKEATFSAHDLEKTSDGSGSMVVMTAADLPDIEVVDHDVAEKEMKKMGKSLPSVSDDDDVRGKSIGEE